MPISSTSILPTLKYMYYHAPALHGWAENSTPGIYQWNLPFFPGMANKAKVANTGKYNFLPRNIGKYDFSCKMQQISLEC